MPNVIEYASFNLRAGVSTPDFLLASDRFNDLFLSAQHGYVSRKLLAKDGMWADLVVWETMDDAVNALNAANNDAVAVEYVSLMDEKSIAFHHFTIQKSY